MHNFGKVAVLMGGFSAEREVSLQSGEAVLKALKAKNIDAHMFDPKEKNITLLKSEKFDVVFNILHGGMGENGQIQATLETLGIPYTGSEMKACVISDDKYLTKLVWNAANIPTPDFIVINKHTPIQEIESYADQFGFPVFLKPTNEGSSVGVHKIYEKKELSMVVEKLKKEYETFLLEKFISGGEYSCPVINGKPFPMIHIEPQTDFYDYEAKYLRDDTVYHCPAGLSDEEEEGMRNLALRAYHAIGCSGWARIDVLKGKEGQFYALEANVNPGMTSHSLVPLSARVIGLSFEDLCLEILKYVQK